MRTSRNAQRNLWDEFMRAGQKNVPFHTLSMTDFKCITFLWLQMHCMQMLKKSPTANFGNSFFTLDFQTAERDEQVSRRNQRLANLIYKMF